MSVLCVLVCVYIEGRGKGSGTQVSSVIFWYAVRETCPWFCCAPDEVWSIPLTGSAFVALLFSRLM